MPIKKKITVSSERLRISPILKKRKMRNKISHKAAMNPSLELAKTKELVKNVAKKSKR